VSQSSELVDLQLMQAEETSLENTLGVFFLPELLFSIKIFPLFLDL
jgi:hypothetical protein